MNNKTFVACLIALFGLVQTANVAAQVAFKLPPQGVLDNIQPANILISLDTSGSMRGQNMENAVRAIREIVLTFGPVANFGISRWNSGGTFDDRFSPTVAIRSNGASNGDILFAANDYLERAVSDRHRNPRGVFGWAGLTHVDTGGMGYANNYFNGAGRSLVGGNCSTTIVILISDGGWNMWRDRPRNIRRDRAAATARQLLARGIMTVVIGIDQVWAPGTQRWNDYNVVSREGVPLNSVAPGTPLFSGDSVGMTQQLSARLSTILAESFSATAPAVMSSTRTRGLIFQPTFEFRNQGQWRGSLRAYSLDTEAMNAVEEWNFGTELQKSSPTARRLWTAAPGLPSANTSQNNNFVDTAQTFRPLSNAIGGLTDLVNRNTINFVRGVDVYDDNRNGQRTDVRHMLGDIFHSKPVYVGPPEALDASDTDLNGVFGYFESPPARGAHQDFVNAQRGRRAIVLAASNSGVLHAVDATVGLPNSGTEVWGFVPPPILNKLQRMNPTNNLGASQSQYMIDGNITVRDVFINNRWRTYAAFGYGLGARAFTVIDITNVESPSHVLSIEHEFIDGELRRINVWDQNGNRTDRTNDPAFAEYRQLGFSTSAPIFTFHRNSAGVYAPVLLIGAGSIHFQRPPSMELEIVGGTRRPFTGNAVFMVGLDGTVGRLLRTVPLNNPASLYSGCTNTNCPVPYNQQVSDIEIIEGGGSSTMKGAYGFELFIPNYSGSIQALNLSAATPGALNTTVNPRAIFDPGTNVTRDNDQVISVPISISGLTHERTDGRLNITFGTGNMLQLGIQGIRPRNKVYSLQGNESNIVNGREVFSVNDLVPIENGRTACPMPPGRRGWQLDVNGLSTTARTTTGTTAISFVGGKVAAKITQYGGSTVVPLYRPRTDNQCSIGDSGIYLFDSVCGGTRQSQAFSNAMIGGVSIIGDTLVIGISGGLGRANVSTGNNNFQKIDNLIIGKGVFDTNNTGSGKGTATIYNKQQVR